MVIRLIVIRSFPRGHAPLLIIWTFFLFMPSLWAHTSLFFTQREVRLICQNLLPVNKSKRDTSCPALYLSAIVYIDATHWAIWLNNRMIRSDDPHQINGFYIERVTPIEVKFSCDESPSSIPKTFTLRPHQVFYGKENEFISKETQ